MENSSGGIGCLTVLGLIFIVLKLVGTIDWSWWLVLLPFYGQLIQVVLLVLVTALLSKN